MPESLRCPPGPDEPFTLGPDDETREALTAWIRAYGDIMRVPPGDDGHESWVVHGPDDVRHVLVRNHRNYTKGVGLNRVKILLGNGIMVSEGDFWRRQRRMIQPAFRNSVLHGFSDLIRRENLRLADEWHAAAEVGEPIEVTEAMSRLSLRIVLEAIFGADVDELDATEGGNPFHLLTEETERDLRFAARFRALTKVVRAAISRRRDAPPEARTDFLGMLMAARGRDDEPMTEKALIDEVMTLVVAGHETTASALAWAWYLLAIHPDAAARLHAEADAIDEAGIDSQTAMRLTVAGQVAREAMRLYPPGWLLSRRAVEADVLGGYAVAPGSHVFICPYLIHRSPAYWDAPDEFRPERFAREDVPAHRFAYIPFAAGPRHCVGESMAMIEMLMHLGLMARRFRVEYADAGPPRLESHINLRARDGIRVHLIPR